MIGVIGVSHKSAAVEIREKFVLNEEEIIQLTEQIKQDKEFDGLIILSTCNRTEIYYNQAKSCRSSRSLILKNALCSFKQVQFEDYKKHFYSFTEEKAIRHLFEVTSGIDSLVIGEDQIIGQVKEAYRIGVKCNATGAVFNRLFHKAFEVGKKVRSQTAINQGILSVSYAAVELASQVLKDLSSKKVLLIGAGETGELVLRSLIKKGTKDIVIANRTLSRAEELANRYQGTAIALDQLNEVLHQADIVVTSTASEVPIILSQDVQDALEKRRNNAIFFFDLSLPRNVEEKVKELPHVHLYSIDDLVEIVSQNHDKRKLEIENANIIIETITDEFFDWLHTLNLAPTIDLLKKRFNMVAEHRLDFIRKKADAHDYAIAEQTCKYLTEKYVRMIVHNLRELSDNGRKPESIDLINQLLELSKLRSLE